jgi:hypothetical protein
MTDIALKPRSVGMSTAVAIHFKDDGEALMPAVDVTEVQNLLTEKEGAR